MQQYATLSIGIAFRHAKIMQVESRTKQIWLFFDKAGPTSCMPVNVKTYKTKAKQHDATCRETARTSHMQHHITDMKKSNGIKVKKIWLLIINELILQKL